MLFLLVDKLSLPLLAAHVVVFNMPRLCYASGECSLALATYEFIFGGPLQVKGLAGWLLGSLSLFRLSLTAMDI